MRGFNKLKSNLLKFTFISLFLLLLILVFNFILNKNNKNFENIFLVNSNSINKYCDIYKINPRIYISIIYGELYNNFDELDKFDEISARMGYDPSIGFSQIKVSTAYWIEENFSDNYYIKKSKNKTELVNKLMNDSTNILYSIFYVKLIRDKIISKYKIEPSLKLVASYYGRGIDYSKNEIDTCYHNRIGVTADNYYKSHLFRTN